MTTRATTTPEDLLTELHDRNGVSIKDHSLQQPMLLILLRHIGCPFCRKALHELSESLSYIEDCGYRVGLVHMNDSSEMEPPLRKYGLQELPRFHDPDRHLYRALSVPRANLSSVLNMSLWKQGMQLQRQYGFSAPNADPFQLPGAFLIDQGRVVAGEPVLSPDETPDFLALLIRSEAIA